MATCLGERMSSLKAADATEAVILHLALMNVALLNY